MDSQHQTDLIKKIQNKTSRIGIIGLGYVGLPLALRFSAEGYPVLGFEIDNEKIEKINQGISYIHHIPSSPIANVVNSGLFSATNDLNKISDIDILILCLPTPLNERREPDLSFILDTIDSCAPFLRKGQVLSLESTTYPGTTEEELLPRIQKNGLKVGEDFFLIYSPEREDPGRIDFSTKIIPKICSGITSSCLKVGLVLYRAIIDNVVPVSSTRVAEMTKLLENIQRAVNIGLVNEMKLVADKMNIDIHEVIDAASTKPFGFVPYRPGPGWGGHCISIDPFYLSWKARQYGVQTKFIELCNEINKAMPDFVVQKLLNALEARQKSILGCKILMLGISYKKNIDDTRESSSVLLMERLRDTQAILSYSDPYVPIFPNGRGHRFSLNSIPATSENIQAFDCIIIATDHDLFDYDMILKNAKLIVDTRGVYRNQADNVVKA